MRVHLASFGGDKEIAASSDNPTITGDDVDGRFTVRVPLKAGPATDRRRVPREDARAQHAPAAERTCAAPSDTIDFSGYPHIDEVILTGPFKPTGVGDTPSRRRIFVCQPGGRRRGSRPARDGSCDAGAARLSRRRRDRDDVHDADGRSTSAAAGWRQLRRAASTSRCAAAGQPEVRRSASSATRSGARRATVSSCAISSWRRGCRSSCGAAFPTTTLLDVASKGGLQTPAVLEQQVRRMLADPKSQALVDNFVGQWLQLRNLRNKQPELARVP